MERAQPDVGGLAAEALFDDAGDEVGLGPVGGKVDGAPDLGGGGSVKVGSPAVVTGFEEEAGEGETEPPFRLVAEVLADQGGAQDRSALRAKPMVVLASVQVCVV